MVDSIDLSGYSDNERRILEYLQALPDDRASILDEIVGGTGLKRLDVLVAMPGLKKDGLVGQRLREENGRPPGYFLVPRSEALALSEEAETTTQEPMYAPQKPPYVPPPETPSHQDARPVPETLRRPGWNDAEELDLRRPREVDVSTYSRDTIKVLRYLDQKKESAHLLSIEADCDLPRSQLKVSLPALVQSGMLSNAGARYAIRPNITLVNFPDDVTVDPVKFRDRLAEAVLREPGKQVKYYATLLDKSSENVRRMAATLDSLGFVERDGGGLFSTLSPTGKLRSHIKALMPPQGQAVEEAAL